MALEIFWTNTSCKCVLESSLGGTGSFEVLSIPVFQNFHEFSCFLEQKLPQSSSPTSQK